MKKDKKILLGLLVLGVLLFAKKPETAMPPPELPAMEPEPLKPADMPNAVSGRYPLRNYKTA